MFTTTTEQSKIVIERKSGASASPQSGTASGVPSTPDGDAEKKGESKAAEKPIVYDVTQMSALEGPKPVTTPTTSVKKANKTLPDTSSTSIMDR